MKTLKKNVIETINLFDRTVVLFSLPYLFFVVVILLHHDVWCYGNHFAISQETIMNLKALNDNRVFSMYLMDTQKEPGGPADLK